MFPFALKETAHGRHLGLYKVFIKATLFILRQDVEIRKPAFSVSKENYTNFGFGVTGWNPIHRFVHLSCAFEVKEMKKNDDLV